MEKILNLFGKSVIAFVTFFVGFITVIYPIYGRLLMENYQKLFPVIY